MRDASTARLTFRDRVFYRKWLISALWPGLIISLGLLPIWTVRYPPLNDYPSHLVEAQVVAHYNDPALAYAPEYQIRPGWYLRSNALTTLLLAGLARFLPIELAGKLTLSLYVVLMTLGLAALLHELGRPRWLLLALPVLIFNMTFMSGFLNWSYGLALIPFALLSYRRWQQDAGWALVILAGLALVIYVAHALAWGICLLILYSLAVTDGLPLRRYLLLTAALSSALPMLAVTRPGLMLGAIILSVTFWMGARLLRRFRSKLAFIALLAYAGAILFLAAVGLSKNILTRLFPSIIYNLHDKLLWIPRTFTLPYQQFLRQGDMVAANVMVLVLLSAIAGIVLWSSLIRQRRPPFEQGGWLTALSVLGWCYLVGPFGALDTFYLDLRIFLAACVIGLPAVCLPPIRSRPYRMLTGLLVALAVLSFSTILVYSWHYDRTAHNHWLELNQLPPARRVLVLPNLLHVPPGRWSKVMLLFQSYRGHHFASTYVLEKGGFVSGTFFNGPLKPLHPELIPDDEVDFRYVEFVRQNCTGLHAAYDYIVLWNPSEPAQLEALRDCGAEPVHTGPVIAIWKWRS